MSVMRYLDKETRAYFVLIVIMFLLGATYILINRLFFQFTGVFYLPMLWVKLSPVMLVLLIVSLWAIDISPRMSYFTKAYTIYFFFFVSLAILSTGIQYTPFPLIDKYLVQIDQLMGFNSIAVINWTYSHPWLQNIFVYCYASLGIQLALIPLVLAILMDKEGISLYYFSMFFAYLIGTTIYYFFPTAGPTVIFHDPNFMPSQHATVLKFLEVHHRLKLTTTAGGMIAFPSFHVIWACLLTYACRNKKWLYYPMILLNIVVIASTVFLGWHYLTDVFGGLLLAVIATWLGLKTTKKLRLEYF